MHNLQPNTAYRVVPILLAVRADIDEADLSDGLNEILNDALRNADCVIADYSFHGLTTVKQYETSRSPEEGEPFSGLVLSKAFRDVGR